MLASNNSNNNNKNNSNLKNINHKNVNDKSNHTNTNSNSGLQPDINLKYQVVFVDPLDYDAPYWWPALVVPKSELPAFKKQVGNFKGPKNGECVVCYFENCSYSVIGKNDILPFSKTSRVYSSYLRGENKDKFLEDNNVKLAIKYLETGELPSFFEWTKSGIANHKTKPLTSNNINREANKNISRPTNGSKRQIKNKDVENNGTDKMNNTVSTSKKRVFFILYNKTRSSRSMIAAHSNKNIEDDYDNNNSSSNEENCYCCKKLDAYKSPKVYKKVCLECCGQIITLNKENREKVDDNIKEIISKDNKPKKKNKIDDGLSSPLSEPHEKENINKEFNPSTEKTTLQEDKQDIRNEGNNTEGFTENDNNPK